MSLLQLSEVFPGIRLVLKKSERGKENWLVRHMQHAADNLARISSGCGSRCGAVYILRSPKFLFTPHLCGRIKSLPGERASNTAFQTFR